MNKIILLLLVIFPSYAFSTCSDEITEIRREVSRNSQIIGDMISDLEYQQVVSSEILESLRIVSSILQNHQYQLDCLFSSLKENESSEASIEEHCKDEYKLCNMCKASL